MISRSETNRSERRRVARRRVSVSDRGGMPVFSVGERAVWDAGDLARLSVAVERFAGRVPRRPELQNPPAVAIDMAGATGLPTGFWDRLCRWTERGFRVFLLDPEPEVCTMRWFDLSARPLLTGGLGRVYELRGVARACDLRGRVGRTRAADADGTCREAAGDETAAERAGARV